MTYFRFLIKVFIPQLVTDFKYSRALYLFNKNTNNDIQSKDVNLNAIKGNNIAILKGTYVSGDSEIGNNTYIGFNCLISKTVIGNYCSIASNVNIGHGEHPIENISTSTIFMDSPYEFLTRLECTIGNDVWIGVGSIIKRGVTIGNGAIIGANSFINKDVPPFSVVVGSPGKILRYRFDRDKIDKIVKTQWWNFAKDEAASIIKEIEKSNQAVN
jgi:acetyltransferase-like isoleucine patch superfamily enzyme